jgi:DMSO/TMAO reductase YedYZ molybdopterin-dependent catalytic subunit
MHSITRRSVIAGSVGSLLTRQLPAAEDLQHALPIDTAPERASLSGKRSLLKRSWRPPNFETPLADLRQPFTANDAFFVRYHLSVIPEIDARTWRLRVGGPAAQRALELSLDDLKRSFERVSVAAVNQCSGNRRGLFTPRVPGVQWGDGAMGNALWTGVRLRDVLAKAQLNADALEIVLSGADSAVLPATPGFAKSLPVDKALDENTLIAFEMNGRPLPHWNGAPARLVVPGWTATYWMKHLSEIRAVSAAFDGFWMKSAYRLPAGAFKGARFPSQEASDTVPITEILVNSLVTSHVPGERLARSRRAALAGWAWDGGAGIAGVDFSMDGGSSWRPAQLGKDLGRFAWRGFEVPLDTTRVGPLTVQVRAASRDGAKQPATLTPNPSGYHHNMIQSVPLEVA